MVDQFDQAKLTSYFCSRPQNFAWFLGAGTSRSAGLPTATDIIWDLKRRYYCREENQNIARQDVQNEAVRVRIQSFMDAKGFPEQWAEEEYSTYFEKIFASDKESQRRYFSSILSEEEVSLSVGNRVLGALVASGLTRVMFTTNFDSVVEKSVAEVGDKSIAAFHIEGSRAANEALNNEEFPIYCKLHGDYRYDSIKNLPVDLAKQNEKLSTCLLNAGNRFGFIVAGYSGRDASIMNLLRRVLANDNAFPHGLFWTGLKGEVIPPAAAQLIQEARMKGVNAHYIEIETFDSLMLRLWRNLDQKPVELNAKVQKTDVASVNIPLPASGRDGPLLRFNAFPVRKLPRRCLSLAFRNAIEWADLRKAYRESDGRLILTKADDVWCWGDKNTIKMQFGTDLLSITEKTIPSDISSLKNLHVKGFMGEAICAAIARVRPLQSRRVSSSIYLIADPNAKGAEALKPLSDVVGKTSGIVPGLFSNITAEFPCAKQVWWAEAIRTSIDIRNDAVWFVIDPDIWIWPRYSRRDATEFLNKRRRGRFNQKYDEILSAWVEIVFATGVSTGELNLTLSDDPESAENPAFLVTSKSTGARKLSI